MAAKQLDYVSLAPAMLKALKNAKGDQVQAAASLGISRTAFYTRLIKTRALLGSDWGTEFGFKTGGAHATPDDVIHDMWRAFERYSYHHGDAAKSLGINEATFRQRIKVAQAKFG